MLEPLLERTKSASVRATFAPPCEEGRRLVACRPAGYDAQQLAKAAVDLIATVRSDAR